MKTFKAKYISDKNPVFMRKGEVYDVYIPKDDIKGSFYAFHLEDIDEPGDYALPATYFEPVAKLRAENAV